MKKLLFLLGLVICTLAGIAQTTQVNGIQVKSQAGTPSGTTPGSNSGLVVADGSGMYSKKTILAAIGSRTRQVIALNDTTLQVITDSATYTFKFRGGLTPSRQAFLDSAISGLLTDSTILVNTGAGTTLGHIVGDSIILKRLKDSTIRWITGADSALRAYLDPTGITPGTYGDASHIPLVHVMGDGRIDVVGLVAISNAKKSPNTQSGTTYTIASGDSLSYIMTTNASPVTITIPDDATAPMSFPMTIELYQLGAGKVTLSPLNGNVTINSPSNRFRLSQQFSKVVLNKIAANRWILSGDLDTTSPATLSVTGTLSAFTTQAGTPSADQTFTFTGVGMTGNTIWTAGTGMEVSTNGTGWGPTATYSPSGGNVSGTVHNRVAGATAAGSYSGSQNGNAAGAVPVNVAYTATVTSGPTLSATPTSLGGFTSVAGSQGAAQTYTLTGSNLTANVIVTAVTGYVVSKDGSTFGTSATIVPSSGSVNQTISIALASTNTAGAYSGNIVNSSTGASPFNVSVNGNTTATGGGNAFATIVIDHTKVPNTDQANFPFTVSGTYTALKSIANGGTVTDINNMIFSTNSAGTSIMTFEIEYWNPVTGQIVARVKVPTLSHVSDNTIYLVYGALGYNAFQGGVVGAVYDANTQGVYHLSNGTTLSAVDASTNAFNGTITGATATAGQLDGAAALSGTTQYISLGNHLGLTGALTISAWVKPTDFSGFNGITSKTAGGAAKPFDYYLQASTGKPVLFVGDGSGNTSIIGTSAPTAGAWNYIVVTFDPTTQTITHYLNGNLNGSSVGAGYPGGASGTDNTYIGTRGDFVTMFKGAIDDVIYSNSVRSGDWTKSIFNNQSSPSTFYSINF